LWWVSKSVGPAPPKGTIQVTTYDDSTGSWSVTTYPPFDPASPPAGLPPEFAAWLATPNGTKWYADPPTAVSGCAMDEDDDGVTDIDEMQFGTDPTSPDTDLDGFTDRDEIRFGSNP